MPQHNHRRAVGQLLVAALCWSIAGVLVKPIAWPPLAVAGGRGLIAALFLIATHRQLRFTGSRVQLGAAAAYAACTITFVTATKLTTAANAILLQYTAPIYIALFGAWFLGERTRRRDWLTIAIVLGGMLLFFADELKPGHALGNGIAVASGFFFAMMTLLLRKQKDGSPIESIILGNLAAFFVGLPWMVTSPWPSSSGLAALLALGCVQLGVSYLLYARAIKQVTALEAVLIPVIEPILNPLWTLWATGERPGRWALVGGAIVLGGVTVRAVLALSDRPESTGPALS
jgi:drug/metabolite transporter (DMT)-like permease